MDKWENENLSSFFFAFVQMWEGEQSNKSLECYALLTTTMLIFLASEQQLVDDLKVMGSFSWLTSTAH